MAIINPSVPLVVNNVPAKQIIQGSKTIALTENQKIAITIDGVDDADLVFTVPAGKSGNFTASLNGSVA